MTFMAVLESDLRALSTEARRKFPAVKDAAEHAILKLRSLSKPTEIAHNVDILHIFLMACDVKSVKLSVIGLSCLQKLISHEAVAPSSLHEILSTLKDHAELTDESVQLKTLQTILIIFQSHLHPDNENDMAQALGICLLLLENHRSSDSVHSTAAATFRQAVALIFDHVLCAESLSAGKVGSGKTYSRTTSVIDDLSRNIILSVSLDSEIPSGGPIPLRKDLSKAGSLGLRVLEDLAALAGGGSAHWLRVTSLQRTFALDILEFILSNYVTIFRSLLLYEQVLRHQICSLLMTSLRTNIELEGEAGEPQFRRLVLRSVAHVIRHYSSSLVTECEVFLNMLLRITSLDLPLWHRILVLEVLRGFCVEVRTLQLLFLNFDMNPKNTCVVEGIVKALARVVSSVQALDSSEESLVAVAGMFSSKAKGIEWSLDTDAPNAAVLVASEAHAITLAVEGLLGIVFTVATLTDEAMDIGELESPRCDDDPPSRCSGQISLLCLSMVDSLWLTILDALSLILTRSQGEAIIIEILKGYQAFTQACGVLRAIEPLNSFLASLCKFTISAPNESERRSVLQTPGSKRSEFVVEQREVIILTSKNVQALRTLFNIAHRLHNMLGPSWVLVLETLAALDRAIHSPHATTQEASSAVPRLARDTTGHYSDFNILSSLNSQLFESSALMHLSSVKSLLCALRQLSTQSIPGNASGFGQNLMQQTGTISFSVERMISILVNNLHRVLPLWNQIVDHFLELAENPIPQLRIMALDALDQSICAVLGSDQFQRNHLPRHQLPQIETIDTEMESCECAITSPLKTLYMTTHQSDVRAGTLKILLHVLERHGDKLHYSWSHILELLRFVANSSERELVPLGFQSVRVIMNDGLSTIPLHCLHVCIEVTGEYSAQKTEINISLTAIGLLWTATDFIAKDLHLHKEEEETGTALDIQHATYHEENLLEGDPHLKDDIYVKSTIDRDKLLFSIFSILRKLGADERPEVRNSAVRTLFQSMGSHGQKFSRGMWEDCLQQFVLPILNNVTHMAATSSRDEWQGKELGTRDGKAVHMLVHHSRNTAQKQWDETLVLVLGGISRLLRSFFSLLQSLDNFWTAWESLLKFARNSILNGSKEVALAAVSCLQISIVSHCSKGNLPMPYLVSVLDIYEFVLQTSQNYSKAAIKIKQEILHSLGDLCMQTKIMFDKDMYSHLLDVIEVAVIHSGSIADSSELELENISPLQQTFLEILPMLPPAEQLSSMWCYFLQKLLGYLPQAEVLYDKDEAQHNRTPHTLSPHFDANCGSEKNLAENSCSIHERKVTGSEKSLFREKLVPTIVGLFASAPASEKYYMLPEIIQCLGRCMSTRRDNPNGTLWRVAVEGFIKVILDDINALDADFKHDKMSRARFWKEVSDIYEIFLVGSCGRALPSNALTSNALKNDEHLDMIVLDVLGDNILKTDIDVSKDILKRLISTLDRCASRTGSLPMETLELLPPHCSRFSLACLHKVFSLCSYTHGADWHSTRFEVSKISILTIISRCESILNKFLVDENDLGERQMPGVRIEEMVYILQQLARLTIHPDTISCLPLQPHLKECIKNRGNHCSRAHLLVLFPSFCELVVSREERVRNLVQVLLRLITTELGLHKTTQAV